MYKGWDINSYLLLTVFVDSVNTKIVLATIRNYQAIQNTIAYMNSAVKLKANEMLFRK